PSRTGGRDGHVRACVSHTTRPCSRYCSARGSCHARGRPRRFSCPPVLAWHNGARMSSPEPTAVSGVLQVLDRGGGFLRDAARSFAPSRQDVFVPAALIDRFRLISGAHVSGTARPERQGLRLDNVEAICEITPAAFRERAPFEKLTATQPDRRFRLGTD